MTTLTWKRDGPGRQISTDGRYAVASDGYPRGRLTDTFRDADGRSQTYSFGDGGEWAAVWTASDENLDWFPTMREAKAFCEADAARRAAA